MRRIPLHIILLALALLAGCAQPAAEQPTGPARPVPTLFPTLALPTAAPARPPAATPPPDSGWLRGPAGIELRRLHVERDADVPPVPLVIVRCDPGAVRLRVAYAPERPRALRSWFAERRPLAAINGGFFTPEFAATALLVSDGTATGQSYEGFGGMLTVASDGVVAIRPLRDEPYQPGEPLDQALQSFPMLVFPGGAPAAIDDDGQRARRSAIALDRAGRLLLIAGPSSGLTLRELAAWLSASDLEVDRALNLDGGSSTGLFLKDGPLEEAIDSFGALPIVLLVEARA